MQSYWEPRSGIEDEISYYLILPKSPGWRPGVNILRFVRKLLPPDDLQFDADYDDIDKQHQQIGIFRYKGSYYHWRWNWVDARWDSDPLESQSPIRLSNGWVVRAGTAYRAEGLEMHIIRSDASEKRIPLIMADWDAIYGEEHV